MTHRFVRVLSPFWVLALIWCALPAQASTASLSVAVGGLIGTSGGLPVDCSSASCNEIVFTAPLPGARASVNGSLGVGAVGVSSFSALAVASADAVDVLRARAQLSAAGEAVAEHIWFANASATVDAMTVFAPLRPDDLGMAVSASLRFRFSGTLLKELSGPVDALATAGAMVFLPSVPSNGWLCLSEALDPGFCSVSGLDAVYGRPLAIEVMLQTAIEARVLPTPDALYSANIDLDYSQTLEMVGASLFDSKGKPLLGWEMRLSGPSDGNRLLFTSLVPEPGAALLMLAGLAGLAVLRRRARAPAGVF